MPSSTKRLIHKRTRQQARRDTENALRLIPPTRRPVAPPSPPQQLRLLR